jgi:outer membrane protein assembly factor BamB
MLWFRSLSALTLMAFMAPLASAEDWPQWLGPRRDGSTAEKVNAWKGDLKIAWRQAVPEAHSSPVVADGKVYFHACLPKKDVEVVACHDAATGNEVWRFEYERGPFQGLFGRGPRATPCVADGKVYAFGATAILTCLDAKSGAKIWQVDTRKEFSAPALKFGASSSPLVAGNKVLVAVGGKGASVVAFDTDKGTVIWKSQNDLASYSSPILIGGPKDPTAVFLTHSGLLGLRLEDGRRLWSFPFEDKLAESSTTPVRVGDKLLISSITLGTALVSLESEGGKTIVKKDWMTPDVTCYFSTPVAVGLDYVYVVTGSFLVKSAKLHCMEVKTGKVLWTKDRVGEYHASLTRTGDDKLLMVEESGNLVLVEPNPKKYEELARSKICSKTWAHPAVADGRLYIRDQKELVCVELPR